MGRPFASPPGRGSTLFGEGLTFHHICKKRFAHNETLSIFVPLNPNNTNNTMKTYYLWTVNSGARITVTCWASGTRSEMQRANLNRWHGNGYVSTISDPDKARRRFTGLAHNENS